MIKCEESGMVDFFSKKNLRKQFDVVFDSESNDDIFESLTSFGGKLWQKNLQKKVCVGCSWRTNLIFTNRHNSPPNGARDSKIPSFDSESKTSSKCFLRFFWKKNRPSRFLHILPYIIWFINYQWNQKTSKIKFLRPYFTEWNINNLD